MCLLQVKYYFTPLKEKNVDATYKQQIKHLHVFTVIMQYNFIAKCQYSCSKNVLWCQVHSSHIHANHKTSLKHNNKHPGKKVILSGLRVRITRQARFILEALLYRILLLVQNLVVSLPVCVRNGMFGLTSTEPSIQYNFIAKCQYNCTRNVLWCQVHSSHIHSNHKTLSYNNSK